MGLIVFAQHASDQQFPRSVATFHAGSNGSFIAAEPGAVPSRRLICCWTPRNHQDTAEVFFFFFRAEDADIRDLSTPGAASEGSEDAAAAVGDLLTSAH